jgi:hypothetical protein
VGLTANVDEILVSVLAATAFACCCCTTADDEDDDDETSPLRLVIAADKLAALLVVKTDVVDADDDADGCDDEEPNELIDVAIRSAVELLDEDEAGCCCWPAFCVNESTKGKRSILEKIQNPFKLKQILKKVNHLLEEKVQLRIDAVWTRERRPIDARGPSTATI